MSLREGGVPEFGGTDDEHCNGGDCPVCNGDGGNCECGAPEGYCHCPPCGACKGTGECQRCRDARPDPIRTAIANARDALLAEIAARRERS